MAEANDRTHEAMFLQPSQSQLARLASLGTRRSAAAGEAIFDRGAAVPRIFAAGDVRSGSVKRAASAVRERSVVVPLIHKVLAE